MYNALYVCSAQYGRKRTSCMIPSAFSAVSKSDIRPGLLARQASRKPNNILRTRFFMIAVFVCLNCANVMARHIMVPR